MTLTKQNLVEQVAGAIVLPRRDAANIVEAALELIKSSLVNGDGVLISGFGKFMANRKAARNGSNPKTGEALTLKARTVVTFSCSRTLRRAVNGDGQHGEVNERVRRPREPPRGRRPKLWRSANHP